MQRSTVRMGLTLEPIWSSSRSRGFGVGPTDIAGNGNSDYVGAGISKLFGLANFWRYLSCHTSLVTSTS